MPNHPNSLKRRKVSSFSTSTTGSAHPLRQTSFPPEESSLANEERSPSVESDYTAVTGKQSVAASGISGKQAKGKGKRKRGEGSVRSGTVKGQADERSATGRQEEDEEEEVDGEDEGEDGVVEDGAKVDKAQEKRKLAYVHCSTRAADRGLTSNRQHPDGGIQ